MIVTLMDIDSYLCRCLKGKKVIDRAEADCDKPGLMSKPGYPPYPLMKEGKVEEPARPLT